ncbi:phosphotransferase family protein [Aliikangiella coralliicola]|uniref:Aminoglycoside phosphotransferase family protein n=1 Tax=Aliikangiella coralliicola TaxID=2592383 RepID=A0A545UJF3_9GAMM|nr:aminoglycoside phosphotransferase family protein [Aliikangiella coralliicola]TQV89591.1 aminoglycoside phosphotransferase family protein [Aliikangiella coralliicola]
MEDYINRIQSIFSDPIETCNVIQTGWSNIIIEVNNQWIFRFVRDKSSSQFNVERDFLSRFYTVSPISIPNIASYGEDYILYRRIGGERLSPQIYQSMNEPTRRDLFRKLASFLSSLHSVDFEHPELVNFPYGGSNFWNELWPIVEAHLSRRTRATAKAFFSEMEEQIHATNFENKITHSDLGSNNILFDNHNNNLSGIIDFSDLALTDPAVDFAGFYRIFGHSFVEQLLKFYQPIIEENFWSRIQYHANRKLFFVAYYATHYGFEKHVPSLVNSIEERFSSAESRA